MYSRGGVYRIDRRDRRPRRLEDGCLVDVRWRGRLRLKTPVGLYAAEPSPATYRQAEVCCGKEV